MNPLGITKQVRVATLWRSIMDYVSSLYDHGWHASQVLPVMTLVEPVLGDSVLDELLAAATAAGVKTVSMPNGRTPDGTLTYQGIAWGDMVAKLESKRAKSVNVIALDGRTRLCARLLLSANGVDIDVPTYEEQGAAVKDTIGAGIRANMLHAVKMTRADRLHAACELWRAGKVRKQCDITAAFGAGRTQRTIVQQAWLGAQLVCRDKLPADQIARLGVSELTAICKAPKAERAEALRKVIADGGGSESGKCLGKPFWTRIGEAYPTSKIAEFATAILGSDEVSAEAWLDALPVDYR